MVNLEKSELVDGICELQENSEKLQQFQIKCQRTPSRKPTPPIHKPSQSAT